MAAAMAAELRSPDVEVTIRQITGGLRAEAYDAVVIGAPMIMGWHKDATRFLKRNASALANRPTACFATAASLTQMLDQPGAVPLFCDPWLVKAPRRADHLTYKERYTSPDHYLRDIIGERTDVRLVGIALFGGSVDLTAMNILEKLFVLAIVGAKPGDLLIVATFAVYNEIELAKFAPDLVYVDAKNRITHHSKQIPAQAA